MKKLLFLLLFVIAVCENSEAEDIKGKIIYRNDTVDVIFNIPTISITGKIKYTKLQNKVKYYDLAGKKVKLFPEDVVEIRFSYLNEDIRMLSVRDTHDFSDNFSKSKNIFLKLIIDGELKLFEYHFSDSSGEMTYVTTSYILKRNKGELWWPEQWAFRKDMVNYFSDCPELTRKIQEKEFEISDFVEIVKFYYANCK